MLLARRSGTRCPYELRTYSSDRFKAALKTSLSSRYKRIRRIRGFAVVALAYINLRLTYDLTDVPEIYEVEVT